MQGAKDKNNEEGLHTESSVQWKTDWTELVLRLKSTFGNRIESDYRKGKKILVKNISFTLKCSEQLAVGMVESLERHGYIRYIKEYSENSYGIYGHWDLVDRPDEE